MNRIKLITVLLFLFGCGTIYAQSPGAVGNFCVQGAQSANVSGLPSTNKLQGIIPSCQVKVYLSGTTTLATIYANPSMGTLNNPFTANTTGQWLFYAAQSGSYDVVLSGGFPPNVYPFPVVLTGLISEGGGGAGGASITVNGGAALASPVNFADSSGNGAINVTNPSGNNVLETLATPYSLINGVNCPLGATGCALPPYCAGPTCANLDQNNPDFATAIITTTAAVTSTSLTWPIASTTGWPSTGCGWTNGAVEAICWDSITPTSLIMNQLSLRRGTNGYSAISHPINTSIEGNVFSLAESPAGIQLMAVSTGTQIGFANGINPGLNQPTIFNGSTIMNGQLSVSDKLSAEGGFVLGGAFPVLTSVSSEGTQVVNCVPGTGIGDVCNDLGSWVAPGGGGLSGLTTGYFPEAASASTLTNGPLDDGITTPGTLTSSEPLYAPALSANLLTINNPTGSVLATFESDSSSGTYISIKNDDPSASSAYVFYSSTGTVAGSLGVNNESTAYLPNDVILAGFGGDVVVNAGTVGSFTGNVHIIRGSPATATDSVLIDTNGIHFPMITTTPSTALLCLNGTGGALTTCTGGGLSGLIAGYLPIATSSTTVGNSTLDYNVTNAGDFTFGDPILAPVGSEVDGSPICTTATGCGAGSTLTLTTTGTSGAATYSAGVLNVPEYVAPSEAYLLLNPTGSQTVDQPSASTLSVYETNTAFGSSTMIQDYLTQGGQGFDLGNGLTSTHNLKNQYYLGTTRGNNQIISTNVNNYAAGDLDVDYRTLLYYGGLLYGSDEGPWMDTDQMHQAPLIYGPLVQPSTGTTGQSYHSLVDGNVYFSVAYPFLISSPIASVTMHYLGTTVAGTAQIGATTLGSGNTTATFTPSQVVTVTVPAVSGAHDQTWSVAGSTLPPISASAGQVLSFASPSGGNAVTADSGSTYCLPSTTMPTSGTFTMQIGGSPCQSTGSYGNLEAQVLQTAPTTGSTSVTISPISHWGYLDYNLTAPMFSDGGILIDTTQAVGTGPFTFGTWASAVGMLAYPLTAGTVPISNAYGILSGCSGAGNGESQTPVAVTCTVTPDTAHSSGAFTTAANVSIAAEYSEEATVSSVTALSGGTQTIVFTSTYPPASHNSGTIGQGGLAGTAVTNLSGGYVIAWQVVASLIGGDVLVANCAVGGCQNAGGVLPTAGTVYFYPMAFINGTNGAVPGSAQLLANHIPFTLGDNLVGTLSSEVSGGMHFEVYGRTTPIDYSRPGAWHQMVHDGPLGPAYDWNISDNGTLTTSTNTMMKNSAAYYGDIFDFGQVPGHAFLQIGDGPITGFTGIQIAGVYGYGALDVMPTGWTLSSSLAAISFSAPGFASAFAAGTTINGILPCLQNGTDCAATAITVGTTTITGGTPGDIEYNNAGVLGEKGVTGTGSVVLSASPTFTGTTSFNGAGPTFFTNGITNGGPLVSPTYATSTNCSSAASPAVCGSAAAGSVLIAVGVSNVQVSTSAVTANSQIFFMPDASLGLRLGVTCNTTLTPFYISTRSPGSSFTIATTAAVSANPMCGSYMIIN